MVKCSNGLSKVGKSNSKKVNKKSSSKKRSNGKSMSVIESSAPSNIVEKFKSEGIIPSKYLK